MVTIHPLLLHKSNIGILIISLSNFQLVFFYLFNLVMYLEIPTLNCFLGFQIEDFELVFWYTNNSWKTVI